ncbi:MAG: glycosyltransferase [Pseudomonadota bacterium]|nr:glycosyltransferase [Pseudomonadota bacterium]MEC8568850.1 glycosyltransferase [Pseudomonadota bacterium]
MHIVIVHHSMIPVYAYGGTERVIWDLARVLVEAGHRVTFLVPEGSSCDFADVRFLQPEQPWASQIPNDADVVHFQFQPQLTEDFDIPYVVTEHTNIKEKTPVSHNTIFVSKDQALRYGSDSYVLNGLDWRAYGEVDWSRPRDYYHFLGKAAWRVKNVKGAIQVAKKANVELHVLGGDRFNIKRGFRWTLSRSITFHGMVGGEQKNQLLNGSRGMIFPVRWHEPFGLAIIESLYFGTPIFATPYGAIPELVPDTCGVLSADSEVLAEAIRTRQFDPMQCHEHAKTQFDAYRMMLGYLEKYHMVIAGQPLNAEQPCLKDDFSKLAWC